jgi:predicted peptidase
MKRTLLSLSIVTVAAIGAWSQTAELKSGQQPMTFEKEVTEKIEFEYLLYVPKDYGKEDKKWPTIVFLHGMGERGDDLNRVKEHGPPKILEGRDDFEFIVISPQCPRDRYWRTEDLSKFLSGMEEEHAIDKDRIYLTGLSMGGFGTWKWAGEEPERFAAIAPICGGGEPITARRLREVPIWVFHGAKDRTVPLERSQQMVDAIKERGGEPKFTIYPEAGHDSWTETYENPELYSWFLSHSR